MRTRWERFSASCNRLPRPAHESSDTGARPLSKRAGGVRIAPALAALLIAASSDAAADTKQAGNAAPVTFSKGIRARIENGKLRPAKLVFADRAVTVEQGSIPPLRFAYSDLQVRRGRHYRGGPLFEPRLILEILLGSPSIVMSSAGAAVAAVGGAIAGTTGTMLIVRLINRNRGYWLELHTHRPNRSAYLRLPRKQQLRQALSAELARRIPKELIVRPPDAAPNPQGRYVPAEGDLAPDFMLEDMDGTSWRLSELQGKVVLLNFWATWCGPCREEMPHLENLHRRFAEQGLVVLGVNDETADRARQFLEETGITFPNLHSADGQEFRLYAIDAIPTSLIVDRSGRIRKRFSGFPGERFLAKDIKEALAAAKPK